MTKPARNDIDSPVPKFCFGLEVHRRTPDGRVRSAQEFLTHFFPHDKKSSTDRVFHYMPNDVRAPILTAWGVRGKKSALLDDNSKVQSVVHDALVAGDIDAAMFEEALASETIMKWIDLSDWWTFWRGGKITKFTILKALESGYELGLFDADWFLDTIRSHGGKLKGTDVLAEGLNKADLTEWVRRIHESGDGSPRGLLSALGWDQIVAKTHDDVLISVLDAVATKVSLTPVPETKDVTKPAGGGGGGDGKEAVAEAKPAAASPVKAEAPKAEAGKTEAKEPAKAEAPKPAEAAKPAEVKPADAAKAPEPAKAAEPAKPGAATPAKAEPAQAPSNAKPEPASASPKLPGILIPSTAVHDRPEEKKAGEAAKPPADQLKAEVKAPESGQEESIDSESAANLFKDDELIPISSGNWDDAFDGEEGESANAADASKGNSRGSKPPGGKRASRNPPARGAK